MESDIRRVRTGYRCRHDWFGLIDVTLRAAIAAGRQGQSCVARLAARRGNQFVASTGRAAGAPLTLTAIMLIGAALVRAAWLDVRQHRPSGAPAQD
jgi:hypothetical protein